MRVPQGRHLLLDRDRAQTADVIERVLSVLAALWCCFWGPLRKLGAEGPRPCLGPKAASAGSLSSLSPGLSPAPCTVGCLAGQMGEAFEDGSGW